MTNEVHYVLLNNSKSMLDYVQIFGPLVVSFLVLIWSSFLQRKEERRQRKGEAYQDLLLRIDQLADVMLYDPTSTYKYHEFTSNTATSNIWATKEVLDKTVEVLDSIILCHNFIVDYYNENSSVNEKYIVKERDEKIKNYIKLYNDLVTIMRSELGTGPPPEITFSKSELHTLKEGNSYPGDQK